MIPYDELVAALKSWRQRNGLPPTPAEFGAPVAARRAAAPTADDEIYDLSEDSGLIVADDVARSREVGVVRDAADYGADRLLDEDEIMESIDEAADEELPSSGFPPHHGDSTMVSDDPMMTGDPTDPPADSQDDDPSRRWNRR
jgi:hypothetical protein